MIPNSVDELLRTPSEDNVAALLEDDSAVFMVDWREEDDAIVEYCEGVLGTDSLSAEIVNIDADPGFELYISYGGQRTKVPLMAAPEDRHITLRTLNQALAPDYEIRVCVDSNGSDTLAFLPLSATDWAALESNYGQRVAKHFRKIEQRPNLFTEPW
jgi:hypothetical protein